MSAYTVERVLWEICCLPGKADSFKRDSTAHLRAYGLSDAERDMIEGLGVRGLADHGVDQMLLMMTWNVLRGPETTPEYVRRMNQRA
jgi:hypothetical protein